jgi:2-deoxy-D-gluconate 3-dehydrogenase
MLKEFSLEGKTALVTGGSSGIGEAIALVFAEAGADVAVAARTMKNVEAVAEKVRELGQRGVAIQCDVSDSEQVDAMVDKATRELGRIDILVNNAGTGTGGPVAPLPDPPSSRFSAHYNNPAEHAVGLSNEDWDKVLNTNLSSVFYTCRAVGPQMMAAKQGKVINIASTNAIMAYPYGAPYQTSKAGMKMLTKVLSVEWGAYNINVNCILPGWYVTEMTRKGFDIPEIRQSRIDGLPLGRLTDTRDLGLLAVYLASPASDWMTGQAIALDGGETAMVNG